MELLQRSFQFTVHDKVIAQMWSAYFCMRVTFNATTAVVRAVVASDLQTLFTIYED